eukprot:TRINITY_DN25683_c0_g1_i2.p1 TRINITY_DN25683_c0_g1~~TRINITY_DN25683_c0_g1_i2.p1  ORF type:complete len:145 (-),score=25.09 TRINITY_DN25683_c0_g1_i2:79-513(-)
MVDKFCHISQFGFCGLVKIYLALFPCSFKWNPARVNASFTRKELDEVLRGEKANVQALAQIPDQLWEEAYTRKLPLSQSLRRKLQALPLKTLQHTAHCRLTKKDEVIDAATFSPAKWEEILQVRRKRKREETEAEEGVDGEDES